MELGRGRVDLPGVFAVLREIKYRKWAIVELDRVPDPGRTPKEAAETNRRYLLETMHQTLYGVYARSGSGRGAVRSRFCFITSDPCSIIGPTCPAAAFGNTSAIQTMRLRSAPSRSTSIVA